MNNVEIAELLIEKMSQIPFPYHEIIHKQILSSSITVTPFPDLFQVHFFVNQSAPKLPSYLDRMPLSWQVMAKDAAPYCCQLFLKDGFIQVLEIIDMEFKQIKWERVWESPIFADYEYDFEKISKMITGTPVSINNTKCLSSTMDFDIDSTWAEKICFRGCSMNDKTIPEGYESVFLEITKISDEYSVHSRDGRLEFSCRLIFCINR